MKISLVITCYNYELYIKEAIESVFTQSRKVDQVIVINDGSTDDSNAIIKELTNQYDFQYINQENKGIIATRNLAVKYLNSDYNIFLDADDTIPKNYIEELERNCTSFDIVYTPAIDPSTKKIIINPPEYKIETLRYGNYIHSASFIKTSLLKMNQYDPTLESVGYEDFEFVLRLGMLGAKVKKITSTHLLYRQHSDNSRDLSVRDNFKSVQALEYIYWKMLGINPTQMNELRWIHGRLKVATDHVKMKEEQIKLLQKKNDKSLWIHSKKIIRRSLNFLGR